MKKASSVLKPAWSASRKMRHRVLRVGGLAVIATLIGASAAQASTVTIGSPLTAAFSTPFTCNPLCTLVQTELPGAVLASPVDGTVVRWRVSSAAGGAGFNLRVLHPEGFDTFTGVGTSATGTPVSFGTQVFKTNLPIRAGDVIGIEATSVSESIGFTPTSGSKRAFGIHRSPKVRRLGPTAPGARLSWHLTPMSSPRPGSLR